MKGAQRPWIFLVYFLIGLFILIVAISVAVKFIPLSKEAPALSDPLEAAKFFWDLLQS